MTNIPMASADLDQSDIDAVLEVVKSGRLALGAKTPEFERMMAEYAGVKHGIAVNSGTAGLHLIVKSLGIGAGDEVIVPSYTFAASVNAILYEGATPVFVDIDPETRNMDIQDVRRKITPRTKAIMVVDVFGHPAEWDELEQIATEHHLHLIDDCCEALGSEYKGRRIGQFGAAGCFAFYPNKQITTGEGGLIVTDDDEMAALCRSLRNQGRGEMGAWLNHERLGYNYRLDEMSAALGISQMKRLEEFIARREEVARMYSERLKNVDFAQPPSVKPYVRMSWFVYVVTLAEGLDRDPVMEAMEARGVPARGYFSPVHLQPYIAKQFGFKGGELPVTESIARRTIALPFHNRLTEAQVERVVEVLTEVVQSVKQTQ
jgi:perosamine synthetase